MGSFMKKMVPSGFDPLIFAYLAGSLAGHACKPVSFR